MYKLDKATSRAQKPGLIPYRGVVGRRAHGCRPKTQDCIYLAKSSTVKEILHSLALIEWPGPGELALFDRRTRSSTFLAHARGGWPSFIYKSWYRYNGLYSRQSALVSVQFSVCWSLLGGNSWSVLSSLPCLTSLVTNSRRIFHVRAYCSKHVMSVACSLGSLGSRCFILQQVNSWYLPCRGRNAQFCVHCVGYIYPGFKTVNMSDKSSRKEMNLFLYETIDK